MRTSIIVWLTLAFVVGGCKPDATRSSDQSKVMIDLAALHAKHGVAIVGNRFVVLDPKEFGLIHTLEVRVNVTFSEREPKAPSIFGENLIFERVEDDGTVVMLLAGAEVRGRPFDERGRFGRSSFLCLVDSNSKSQTATFSCLLWTSAQRQ